MDLLEGLQPNKSTPQHVNQVLVCFHFGLTGQTDMLMTSQQGTTTFCMHINTSTCKSGFSILPFWFNRTDRHADDITTRN